MLVVTTFAPSGELIIGIDDTIERRRGKGSRLKEYYEKKRRKP
jgi:hypothetical protein